MESNKLRTGVIRGEKDGYTSSERSSSESPRSASSSYTSTTFTERTYEDSRDITPTVIAPRGAFVDMGNVKYATGELRVMADVVSQARKTGELPPTTSSHLDSEATIRDHNLLAQLRLARGDPALPPPGEYTRLRVEAARRIQERDARLGDEECKRAAAERVEGYLRVVGQERRYYELAREISMGRRVKGNDGPGGMEKDMELIADEVMAIVERGIGTTAQGLDSTADIFDAVASSLKGTASTLNVAAASFNTTTITLSSIASTLENTLGVMATQISTLNSQLLTLTDILQSQRSSATPAYPTSHTKLGSPQQTPQSGNLALEGSVRRRNAQVIREVAPHIQTAYCPEASSVGNRSSKASWGDSHYGSASDDTAVEGKTKHRIRDRRGTERRTSRRARKYVGVVMDRILR